MTWIYCKKHRTLKLYGYQVIMESHQVKLDGPMFQRRDKRSKADE
jgi:hypothetical protein